MTDAEDTRPTYDLLNSAEVELARAAANMVSAIRGIRQYALMSSPELLARLDAMLKQLEPSK